MSKRLTVEERRSAFADLVQMQDDGQSVAASRSAVCKRYGITEIVLRKIEEEGLNRQWPPLDDLDDQEAVELASAQE